MGSSGSIAMRWSGLVTDQSKFVFLQTYRNISVRSAPVFVYSFLPTPSPAPSSTDILLRNARSISALVKFHIIWQDYVSFILSHMLRLLSYLRIHSGLSISQHKCYR